MKGSHDRRYLVSMAGAFILAVWMTPLARPDFNASIPIGDGRPVYLPGDIAPPNSRLLSERTGASVRLYWDNVLGTPRYVSIRSSLPITHAPYLDKEVLTEAALSFVDEYREFFGVGAEALLGPWVRRIGGNWLLSFREAASCLDCPDGGRVAVRGASLRLLLNSEGALLSVKAFLLRNPPASQAPFVDFSTIRKFLDDWKVDITFFERQLYFRTWDPSAAEPIWYVRGTDSSGLPWEYFFDPATGDLRERREVVSEFGNFEGDISGVFPDPEKFYVDAGLYQLDEQGDFKAYPVTGARVTEDQGISDASATSDDAGNFVFPISEDPIGTRSFTCKLVFGACDANIPEMDFNIFSCRIPDYSPLLEAQIGDQTCERDRIDTTKVILNSGETSLDHRYSFKFNVPGFGSPPDDFASLALLSFHHARKFMTASFARMSSLKIDNIPAYFPLKITIPEIVDTTLYRHPMEYHASGNGSWICMSPFFPVNEADQGKVPMPGADPIPMQGTTPAMINHEFAHHITYVLSNKFGSMNFDCKPDSRCTRKIDPDPEKQRKAEEEEDILEAIADALAAFHANNPRFGYYADNAPGQLGYNIAEFGVDSQRPIRRELAFSLWSLYFRYGQLLAEGREDANRLLFELLAVNNVGDSSDRVFDLSTFMAEVVDTLHQNGVLQRNDYLLPYERALVDAFAGRSFMLQAPFIRGDANQDRKTDLTDAIFTLDYLFKGTEKDRCLDAMDCDADGNVSLNDPVYLLYFLFLGGSSPLPPFPQCGFEPEPRDDSLSCKDALCPI